MPYEWHGSRPLIRIGGNKIQPGERFEPTDAELKSFDGSITEVNPDDEPETVAEDTDASEDEDYASMDYSELRQLAVDEDTDEINGRSSKDEIIAYFEG